MTNRLLGILLLFGAVLGVFSCRDSVTEEDIVAGRAAGFARLYFNFRYVDALDFATPSSRRVLEFRATNMSQKIIDSLQNITDTPTVWVEDARILPDGGAECRVCVDNEIVVDSIDGLPFIRNGRSEYTFALVKEDNLWKIRMEGLPQSGR